MDLRKHSSKTSKRLHQAMFEVGKTLLVVVERVFSAHEMLTNRVLDFIELLVHVAKTMFDILTQRVKVVLGGHLCFYYIETVT